MSILDSSADKIQIAHTKPVNLSANDNISELGISFSELQILTNANSKSAVLPEVSFHNPGNNSSGLEKATNQYKNIHQTQIEQLVLWNNLLSLLEAHLTEHKIQLDIAQQREMFNHAIKNQEEIQSELLDEIERLKDVFFDLSTKVSNKEKAVESVNLAAHYIKGFYAPDESHRSDFRRIASKLKDLDLEALSLYNEILAKENEVFQLEKKISAEADENQKRFQRLDELKMELAVKQKDSLHNSTGLLSAKKSNVSSVSEQTKLKKRHIITLQHLISGLALSSQVEWHLDPELQEAMLDYAFPSDA